MDNVMYQDTGNNTPVPVSELIAYMNYKLDEYKNNPGTIKINPFVDDMIYTTNDKKMIRIPNDIKKTIIDQWKKKNVMSKKQKVKKVKTQAKDNTMTYLIIFGFIIIGLYFLNKTTYKFVNPMVPNVKYTLTK